tara:strand:+ start:567 stop:743 length:177 start_codon:yes stop_codon:yes gene_type:complete
MIDLKDYKDGVADALLHGQLDETKNSYMYKQGYDFGMYLFNEMEDAEIIEISSREDTQ